MLITCYQNMEKTTFCNPSFCVILKTLMESGSFAWLLCEMLYILKIIIPTGWYWIWIKKRKIIIEGKKWFHPGISSKIYSDFTEKRIFLPFHRYFIFPLAWPCPLFTQWPVSIYGSSSYPSFLFRKIFLGILGIFFMCDFLWT